MNISTSVENFRNEHGHALTKFTYIVLSILGICLPVFFLPSAAVSLSVAKTILLALGAILALAATFLAIIQRGTVRIPSNILSLALISLPVSFLISAIFATDRGMSLWGYGFETQTFGFVLIGVVIAFLSSFAFDNKRKVYNTIVGMLLACGVLGLFHVLRFFFGAGFLSFGIFTAPTSSILGGWSDLSYFAVFALLLSVIVLEMVKLPVVSKVASYVVFGTSIAILAVVNISTAWWVASIIALVFMVYILSLPDFKKVSLEEGGEASSHGSNRVIAWHALAVIIVALAFLLSGSSITGSLSERLGVSVVEVRPSWSATFDIAKASLKENVLLGVGPNNFSYVWSSSKPVIVNESIFWNTDFNSGIGLLPTFFVTNGVIGIASWVFLLGCLLVFGVRSIFANSSDALSRFLSVIVFFATLSLWAIAFVAVPGHVLFGMAFFMTGLFIAGLYRDGLVGQKKMSLFASPRSSFMSVLVLMVSLIGVVSLGFLFAERSLATIYSDRALIAANVDGNLTLANELNAKAISIDDRDSFRRVASQIAIAQISQVLSNQDIRPEVAQTEFQTLLSSAIQNATRATELGSKKYENWMNLGQVYAAVVPEPFNIEGAYESALSAFTEARNLSQTNPSILLSLARLEADRGQLDEAKAFAEEATVLKQNYAEAHFFLAQIAIAQGDAVRAIERTETAAILSPQNAGLFFQLGVLYYNQPNYQNAAAAMTRAIELLPDYANARYFLGLSLWQLEDVQGAIAQFEEIQRTNPESTEIGLILDNLRTGKDPLNGIETESDLPISNE